MKLFGTDGIRGRSNTFPMTAENIVRVGQALGILLQEQSYKNHHEIRKVVIGKDTRLSGYMIEQALSSGLNSMGIHVLLVGPLPTPGIGFLARNMRADAGIVISASHNQYEDNGIKIFGADGYKISDEWEKRIEELVADPKLQDRLVPSERIGRSKRIDDAQGRYIVDVKNKFPLADSLEGARIILDCANGAGYKVGPRILEELGAEVIVIGDEPNGTNINDKCGALFPERLSEYVRQYRADLGISLDGDGDRVIMVDERGSIVNGDHILGICAIHAKETGLLRNNTVVATQMSNFGLEKLLKKHGITLIKTNVGDRYVVEELKKGNHFLGGEQSGHIVFIDHSTTGDGMIAALNVLSVMRDKNKKLSELRDVLVEVPQVLKNVRVSRRSEL
ncbi:MAG: phosphoglucosamine mutase, partial [Bdellovibrionales bacterium]|nr:phosphoglucosamine mutase [Bdellovibrionales bacterium]